MIENLFDLRKILYHKNKVVMAVFQLTVFKPTEFCHPVPYCVVKES